ncbi:MAG: hypothetical protein CMJ46_07770 [Planctomyces sp.]|nr:hypothetical protein [Planctomyces sp.]
MDPLQQQRLLDLLDRQMETALTADEHRELEAILLNGDEAQALYHRYLELEHSLKQHYATLSLEQPTVKASQVTYTARQERSPRYVMPLIAALAAFLLIGWWISQPPRQDDPAGPIVPELAQNHAATFTQLDDARFFDQTLWRMGDVIEPAKEITLRSGLIKLEAAGGAEVILEGPAVFEWTSPREMMLKFGRCSVNVPTATEKIIVQTPSSRVVDLGTSFAIDVTESGESEVQLIEGMADVYHPELQQHQPERLLRGDARQYGRDDQQASVTVPFNEKLYRRQLPDRVVAYRARETADGVDDLLAVTVQRGGELYQYDVNELIGVELSHFSGTQGGGYLVAPLAAADKGAELLEAGRRHRLLDEDQNLATGVINLGGSETPLTSAPLLDQDPPVENTAGMAIRFRQPLVNAAGPDIVLFDLHVVVHPEEGDPFHVSPVEWREGLKAVTITKFDIKLSSPEAQLLVPFRLVKLEDQAFTLEQLEQTPIRDSIEHIVRARILAVGIDLSDLGYAPGETVNELFLQDALGEGYLDPVFIGGLPEITP